jgi:glutamate racemase
MLIRRNNSRRIANPAGPVGVFDSGIGGLSILREIHELMPTEDLCYVADSAWMPYGEKRAAVVRDRSLKIARFLVEEQGCKAIVVACNTATGLAVDLLREELEVPVIAIEPAIKPAIERTQSGVIGVMATPGTLSGEKFDRLKNRFSGDKRIISTPCPGLAKEIERGKPRAIRLRRLLTRFIQPFLEEGADVIVLGCTHYPLVKPMIKEIAGAGVQLIDSGEAVARQLSRKLEESGLRSPSAREGCQHFWCSGRLDGCASSLARLSSNPLHVEALPV